MKREFVPLSPGMLSRQSHSRKQPPRRKGRMAVTDEEADNPESHYSLTDGGGGTWAGL